MPPPGGYPPPGQPGQPGYPGAYSPAYGYANGHGYAGTRQPARRSGGGVWWVAIPLVIVLVIGGVVGIGKVINRSSDYDYSLPPGTSEGSTPQSLPVSAPGSSLPTGNSDGSSVPSGGLSDEPTTTGEPPAEPPPQDSGPQPVYRLGDNPLFASQDAGLPAVTCRLSRWRTDPASAQRFFASALRCLNEAWSPVLAAANLPFEPPRLSAPASGGGSSPCSSTGESFAAYYCGENETIYMPFQTLQTDLYGARPGVYLAVLAHEYGHHVQQLSGIFPAMHERQYRQDATDALTTTRRSELQAQCFSGMFLAASYNGGGDVNDEILNEASNSQDRGDDPGGPRSHGTDAHAIGWWRQGAQYNRNYQCNTWLSPASAVA